jgi:hypothetical protein
MNNSVFTVTLVTKMMKDKTGDENFHIKELGRVCNVRVQRIFFFRVANTMKNLAIMR